MVRKGIQTESEVAAVNSWSCSGLPIERKCNVCGKKFCAREEWVFTRASKSTSHKKWFCSWGCMRKYEAQHGDGIKKPNQAKDDIIRLLAEGKSNKEIAKELGIREAMVDYYDMAYGGLD